MTAATGLDMSLDDMIRQDHPKREETRGKAPRVGLTNRAARRPAPYRAGGAPRGSTATRNAYSFPGEPGRCVYVGNLSWSVTWQDLKDHFKTIGEVVHADVMMESATGRSKGCGLVVFSAARDATTAISDLHDSDLKGRKIFVREDKEEGKMDEGGDRASVYVGNLSWNVSWQDLKDHFKTVGEVMHADVMTEAVSGRSRGCGLVTFASSNDAARAILELHDTELNGRPIFVREDREPKSTSASLLSRVAGTPLLGPPARAVSGGGASHGAAVHSVPGASVYVGNLSWDTQWQDLKDHFKTVGDVSHADVMMEAATGRSKGCGLVTFARVGDAQRAIATMHDTQLGGRPIFVREDREAASKGGGGGGFAVRSAAAISGAVGGGPAIGGGPGCKLYVGNLSFDVSWKELKDLFRQAGTVARADIAVGADGRSKGFGTVVFGSTREAAKAIQLFNDREFMGRNMDVRPDAHV